jgi:hypothetical protein
MCLEANTKPHVHKKIHKFLINMAFTMACPNFKKGLKMAFGPLGVNDTAQMMLAPPFLVVCDASYHGKCRPKQLICKSRLGLSWLHKMTLLSSLPYYRSLPQGRQKLIFLP